MLVAQAFELFSQLYDGKPIQIKINLLYFRIAVLLIQAILQYENTFPVIRKKIGDKEWCFTSKKQPTPVGAHYFS